MDRHPSLDLAAARARFPALAGDWTFLDNAGGSQTLAPVVERVREYLLTSNVQLGASYAPSVLAARRVAEGVATMAAWVGTDDPSEIVLGPSTSMLLRNLAASLGRLFQPGDEVVVTDCDHEANIGPWRALERDGITVRTWKVDPTSWALRWEDLEPLLGPRTRLVAFTHAGNLLGTIHPLEEITARVHAAGAWVAVDGVAYAPHRQLRLPAWDVDFYVFSLYKVYGPHCAVLYAKRALLERLPGINHYFLEDEIPYKLQPGNVNYELTYGLAGLGDYVGEMTASAPWPHGLGPFFAGVADHEERLAEVLLTFLVTVPGVRVLGRTEPAREVRVPTISFVVEGRQSEEIVRAVDRHRIGIRFGDFYARRLVDRLGLAPQGGVVRVSAVHYNTREEIERLVRALETELLA